MGDPSTARRARSATCDPARVSRDPKVIQAYLGAEAAERQAKEAAHADG